MFQNLESVKYYVLLGDYNLPDIDWSKLTASKNVSREFLTFCFKIGASQFVNQPTRGENIIDLVLCSQINFVQELHTDVPFSTSDHNVIICDLIPHSKLKKEPIVKPCFQKADFELINAFLGTLDWDVIYRDCTSAQEYWSAFKGIVDTVILNFVPFVSNKTKRSVPWFSPKLNRLRNIKQRRWRIYDNNRNVITYARYLAAAGKFKSEFISSKCTYEQKLFTNAKVDSKKFHRYVKNQNTVASTIPCLKRNDASLATTDYDKCCVFSEYFCSVFTEDNNILPDFEVNCNSSLSSFTCTVNDVIKTVLNLKNNSAPGADNITPYFLKNVLAHIANPLTTVYNVSLMEGTVPADWKVAYITPIYKKGDAHRASQYRPVSLTSVICKILERIIREQLLKYMSENDFLPKDQHGFLSKKSTVSNLLECLDKWSNTFDKSHSNQSDIIYLDYSKCFDTVCHSKLLYKLGKYGINGSAFNWLSIFLNNRVQHVKINNTLSPPATVSSGVPQGSVLGPLLFLCFSADLPSVIKYSNISIYADDTKLFREISSYYDCLLLQYDLVNVCDWATKWQLRLNAEKTKKLTIGIDKFNFDYSIDGNVIESVESMCDIGVHIQSNLKFTIHCNHVIKKAYFQIHNIFNTFKHQSSDFYLKLYTCYVRPILDSCSQVWSPIQKGNIDRIEKVQRYFTRRLPGLADMPYTDRLHYLHIESLEERRIKSDLTLFYKWINNDVIIDVPNSFKIVSSYRNHDKYLYHFYSRTDKRKYYWSNRLVKYWNSLDSDTVNAANVHYFKEKLKDFNLIGRGSIFCS